MRDGFCGTRKGRSAHSESFFLHAFRRAPGEENSSSFHDDTFHNSAMPDFMSLLFHASQLSRECIAAVMRMHRSCHANESQLSCKCIAAVMQMNRSCHEYASQLSRMNYMPSCINCMRMVWQYRRTQNFPIILPPSGMRRWPRRDITPYFW